MLHYYIFTSTRSDGYRCETVAVTETGEILADFYGADMHDNAQRFIDAMTESEA